MHSGNPSPVQELADEQLQAIVCSVGVLCTLPESTARLIELLDVHAGDLGSPGLTDAVIELAKSDLAMTVKLLAGAPGSTTARSAVLRLGLPAAAMALLAIPFQSHASGALDRRGFWRHCRAVASLARGLADQTDPELADEAFVCGLLHDLGKAALDQCMPKSYRMALDAAAAHSGSLQQCELAALGVDHCGIGRRLAARWRLPRPVEQAVWLHHHAPAALAQGIASRRTILMVSLADTVARKASAGFSGNFIFTREDESIAQELGLASAAVEELQRRLEQELAEEAAARHALASPSAAANLQAVYAGAIRQMEMLARQQAESSRLEIRRVNEFLERLPLDASAADVVGAAATTAATITAACGEGAGQPCLAYVICQDDGILFALAGGRGGGECRNLAPAPGPLGDIADGMSAPEAMQRLVQDPAELGQWADLSRMDHMPLRAGGRWVGGLLLAKAARAARLSAIAPALAAALAAADQRRLWALLGEQLAQAGRSLAAAQEALAESRTLAAIGELASGAAHELNNPLAVISGRAQLMCQRAGDDKERETWQTIVEQAQRISDVLSELMEFASPAKPSPQPLEAAEILRQAAESFAKSGHPQAASALADIRIAEAVPRAYADRQQVILALRELIANATAAAPGATIVLSATAAQAGNALRLAVTDSGPGMEADTLAEAFTPFFSRQPAGRRRGLGLSRARRYVQNSGGRIWIESRSGRGTTVYVELPSKGD